MKESTTYQEMFRVGYEEGRALEAKDIVLELGTKKLGRPNAAVKAQLKEITDRGILRKLTRSLIAGAPKTWADLLGKLA